MAVLAPREGPLEKESGELGSGPASVESSWKESRSQGCRGSEVSGLFSWQLDQRHLAMIWQANGSDPFLVKPTTLCKIHLGHHSHTHTAFSEGCAFKQGLLILQEKKGCMSWTQCPKETFSIMRSGQKRWWCYPWGLCPISQFCNSNQLTLNLNKPIFWVPHPNPQFTE